MSRDEQDFSIENIQLSLKRYLDAKQKAGFYQKALQDESENLFSHFVKYAKEHDEEPCGFSEKIDGFYYEILNMSCDIHDRAIRTSLTRRFKKLMKRYVKDNSRNQVKLDEFML